MKHIAKPSLWLIFLLAGLPILSETVYTPSLPEISDALGISESTTEYTLTIYLLGFALGTLFWGRLSDKLGRKSCVLMGMIIYIIGCMGCYMSDSISKLMIFRLIQALGGSVGSVLSQVICRDAFQGAALSKAYSTVGAALPIFPALGPVIGGFIAENTNWYFIFLFLTIWAIWLLVISWFKLKETHLEEHRTKINTLNVLTIVLKDKHFASLFIIMGGCQGIMFSYFAEGSFYLIEILKLRPSLYGASFIFLAMCGVGGALFSKRLHSKSFISNQILIFGLYIICFSTSIFSTLAIFKNSLLISDSSFVYITIGLHMITMFGISITTNNAMAIALKDYKWCMGTASSLFGFLYYILACSLTFIMGLLHNGTIIPMPLFFLSISSIMFIAKNFIKE